MQGKELLARGIEVVTFLFAMFGGFLTAVAPPEETDARFAVGLSSFLALIVLLFISALFKKLKQKKYRKIWLGVAASAFFYKSSLNELTFPYPPENIRAEWVRGTELTPLAKRYQETVPGKTPSELVADFGGMKNRELVWTPASINHSKIVLLVNYTLLVLSLALSIFCLTEGLLRPTPK